MPVFNLICPNCSHRFKSMVLASAKPPAQWYCSSCQSADAYPDPDTAAEVHPWEAPGGGACLCCG